MPVAGRSAAADQTCGAAFCHSQPDTSPRPVEPQQPHHEPVVLPVRPLDASRHGMAAAGQAPLDAALIRLLHSSPPPTPDP